jgi:TonB-dependent starch-binding outer membrane protein SusC
MKKYLLILLPCLWAITAWSQERIVTGKVTGADDGSPIPGVNVVVQGTSRGTATDAEGNYSLGLGSDENTLVFTFVGYKAATVDVANRTTVDIALELDVTSLEEIVVVGYGTQRSKDLTSAITTIKSEEISKTPTGQAMQALQGKVAGLQIVSSGAPGDAPTVRVRGVGSYPRTDAVTGEPLNTEAPLYVVDGMFYDNIDFLNTADIETISILKDASAAAIYGVRAANGVVLIETKGGDYNQKAQISYDGYYGMQVAQNVLKMANAEQFTNMALESGSASDANYIANAMQRYGRSRINPNVPDVNTDWYKEIMRPAPIQNHSLTVAGGSENTSYSIGGSYFSQDGILDTKNNFERFNLRSKIDYQANKWLKIGGNVNFSNATKYGQDATVAQTGEAWKVAYFAVPIMPVYDETNAAAYPVKYASAQTLGYRDGKNPFPIMDFNNNQNKIKKLQANFYVKLDLIPDRLSFQTTYNNGSTFLNERNVDLPYYISDNAKNTISAIVKRSETYFNQIWDNVLTYNQSFGNHHLVVMAGTSFRDEAWDMLTARGEDLLSPLQEKSWYISQANTIKTENVDDNAYRQYGLSYFGRVSYNFNDRYLLYGTMRADGTSKYQDKWAYFPAVGAGWVISEEAFMTDVDAIDFLKFRAGWGRLGNDKIPASNGANSITLPTTAIDDQLVTGSVSTTTFTYLTWELTEESNIGLTSRLLDNRLSVDADYFVRDTKRAAIDLRALNGDTFMKSTGKIRNTGFEFALSWNDQLSSEISYSIGANFATIKNKTLDLYGQNYIDGGMAEFRQRTMIGEPLLAFFGYETAGVYQNTAQIEADPIAVAMNNASPNSIVPGDFIYKDKNNDGVINDDDRVVLGSYFPTFTYGANLGASYKNFDLSVNIMGQSGNKILNRKRGEIIWTPDGNMDADLAINRWHGEGTSNKYPSSAGLRKGWNQKMSDYFVEDGSFFRIQNVQLAYSIREKELFGSKMPDTKISFTAERPLTVFSYNGFNPEVANGVDTQTYPIPAVYTIGLNVKF